MFERYSFASTAAELPVEHREFVPVDKSDTHRCLALDELEGFNDGEVMLDSLGSPLPDDVSAFFRSLRQYRTNEPVEVGEGGAVYRSLLYRSYLFNEPRTFVKSGTLKTRSVYENPDMITMPFSALLTLDGGTSQYASARLIWDRDAVVPFGLLHSKYKLQITADAITHWYKQREAGYCWEPKKDETIAAQMAAYLGALATGEMDFYPIQAEDFCFAYAYGKMSVKAAQVRWGQLANHESNRFQSMPEAIKQATNGEIITSNDHRVVQAIALRFGLPSSRFSNPGCVTKSFPLFWKFKTASA